MGMYLDVQAVAEAGLKDVHFSGHKKVSCVLETWHCCLCPMGSGLTWGTQESGVSQYAQADNNCSRRHSFSMFAIWLCGDRRIRAGWPMARDKPNRRVARVIGA